MTTTTNGRGVHGRAAAVMADPRWRTILQRDASADGAFVFAVRTTRVYCRPSCAARRPRPENVEFHADAAAAQRAGFRACKRCAPDRETGTRAQLVARLCRALDVVGKPPTLRELAEGVQLSPFHVQRLFRATLGLTPRAYAAALRLRRLRAALGEGASVTAAMHRADYGSSSRFYAEAGAALGMQPKRYRTGGAGEVIHFATAACALGTVLVAATARGVCAILLGDDVATLERDLRRRFPRADVAAGDRPFGRTVAAVVRLVDEPRRSLALPLDIRGTAFQQRVWQALRTIPAGETIGYAQLAERIGAPKAARAVAAACAANPLAVAVPCHRVVRSDGGLSGYRWGVGRKRELLAREARGEG